MIKDVNKLKIDDVLDIKMHVGNVKAIVKEIDKNGKDK